NDRHIAINGIHIGNRPGHSKMASYTYLKDRGVNLIVSHPRIFSSKDRQRLECGMLRLWGIEHQSAKMIKPASRSFFTPALWILQYKQDRFLLVAYIKQHQEIEELIKRRQMTPAYDWVRPNTKSRSKE
ncbi:MAG: hypothetical protein VKI81_04310, partial [Synechococcaceae cyanobacterium]|nr:hypothetical protein [Synechococcaceae cyanobacterium]